MPEKKEHMNDASTIQPGQKRTKKARRLWNRNQGLPAQQSTSATSSLNIFSGSKRSFKQYDQQQQQSPSNFGVLQHQAPASQFTSQWTSQQSTQSIFPEFAPEQTSTPLVTGSGIGSNLMSQSTSSDMISWPSSNLFGCDSTSVTSTFSTRPTSPMEVTYTEQPKWPYTATPTITLTATISAPTKSCALENQPQPSISGVSSFGSAFEKGNTADEHQPDIMRGISFGSNAGNESDPDEVSLGYPMHYGQKRKVAGVGSDENIQSITRKGHDNDTNGKFSNQLLPEWIKSLTISFKKHLPIIPITKTNSLYSSIRQPRNEKTPTSICAPSKENETTNDSAANLHATEIPTSLAQNDNLNKVLPTEQTTSHTTLTATISSASKDIESAKIDLSCSTASDALTANTQHKNSVTSLITKDTGHVASSSINPPSIGILKPSPISLSPTPIITKVEHIQQQTWYNQLPDGARSALLDAEQIISNQQAFSYNIQGTNGAFSDSNILYIKDRACELMNDTGIMMGQLDQQFRTAVYLGMATQHQMDAITTGKTLKNSGYMQHLFATGNHQYYFAQLFEKLQQQLVEFNATAKEIEKRLLLQQEELAPGTVILKLGALIASQNEALLSLAAQASILHEMVQEIHQ